MAIFRDHRGQSLVTPDLAATSWFDSMTFEAASAVTEAWMCDDESPAHVACRYLEPKILAHLIAGIPQG